MDVLNIAPITLYSENLLELRIEIGAHNGDIGAIIWNMLASSYIFDFNQFMRNIR